MRRIAAVTLLSSLMLFTTPGPAGPSAQIPDPQCSDLVELVLNEPGPAPDPAYPDDDESPIPVGGDEGGIRYADITVPSSWEELLGVDTFAPVIEATPCGYEALTLITFVGGETIMTAAGATDVQVDGRHIHVTFDPDLNRRLEQKAARMSRKG